MQRASLRGALQVFYYLAKHEIPHTINYLPMLELAEHWGCNFLSGMRVAENATYTSEQTVQTFLQILADTIEED